ARFSMTWCFCLSSRRRHTRFSRDWSSDVCSSDLHAGEIDGKDAGFRLIRDLLQGKVGQGLLDRQVLLFVPVFNVDGHENFRAWQIGRASCREWACLPEAAGLVYEPEIWRQMTIRC